MSDVFRDRASFDGVTAELEVQAEARAQFRYRIGRYHQGSRVEERLMYN